MGDGTVNLDETSDQNQESPSQLSDEEKAGLIKDQMAYLEKRAQGTTKSAPKVLRNQGDEVEVVLPVRTTEEDNEQGRRRNTAFAPSRKGLPPVENIFGYRPTNVDPEKIVIQEEERKAKRSNN